MRIRVFLGEGSGVPSGFREACVPWSLSRAAAYKHWSHDELTGTHEEFSLVHDEMRKKFFFVCFVCFTVKGFPHS